MNEKKALTSCVAEAPAVFAGEQSHSPPAAARCPEAPTDAAPPPCLAGDASSSSSNGTAQRAPHSGHLPALACARATNRLSQHFTPGCIFVLRRGRSAEESILRMPDGTLRSFPRPLRARPVQTGPCAVTLPCHTQPKVCTGGERRIQRERGACTPARPAGSVTGTFLRCSFSPFPQRMLSEGGGGWTPEPTVPASGSASTAPSVPGDSPRPSCLRSRDSKPSPPLRGCRALADL